MAFVTNLAAAFAVIKGSYPEPSADPPSAATSLTVAAEAGVAVGSLINLAIKPSALNY